MSDDPLHPPELAELLDLPEGDPRRQALERTPSGRALLEGRAAFLEAEAPPGVGTEEVERRLQAAFRRELGLPAEPPAVGESGPARTGRALRPGWIEFLRSPAVRPAFAVASVAVVVGLILLARPRREAGPGLLRGGPPAAQSPGAAALQMHEPRALPGGDVELSWQPFPGADRYEVSFLASDLSDLCRVAADGRTHLTLRRGALPAGLAPGAAVQWQVIARHGADSLGASSIATLHLP